MRARSFVPNVDGLDRRLLLTLTDPTIVTVATWDDSLDGYPGTDTDPTDLIDWNGPGNPPPYDPDPTTGTN